MDQQLREIRKKEEDEDIEWKYAQEITTKKRRTCRRVTVL